MLWQLCDDASDTVLIENNGVARKWVAIPFWSNSVVFNDSSITSVIAELSQRWLWPDTWCKQGLTILYEGMKAVYVVARWQNSWNFTLVLILNPASISTCTTALCPFRDARCNALCLSTVSPRRLGCFLSNSCTVSRRPYWAASSSGDSSLMLRIRGSQWCCK